jgi:hypothetical protein
VQAGSEEAEEQDYEGEHEETAYLAAALVLPGSCWWSGRLRHELLYEVVAATDESA